jgi:hypothetical protein
MNMWILHECAFIIQVNIMDNNGEHSIVTQLFPLLSSTNKIKVYTKNNVLGSFRQNYIIMFYNFVLKTLANKNNNIYRKKTLFSKIIIHCIWIFKRKHNNIGSCVCSRYVHIHLTTAVCFLFKTIIYQTFNTNVAYLIFEFCLFPISKLYYMYMQYKKQTYNKSEKW